MRYFVENLWRRLEHLGEHPSHVRAGNCLASYRITEEALRAIFQRSPPFPLTERLAPNAHSSLRQNAIQT
jgi:hypothetical protein